MEHQEEIFIGSVNNYDLTQIAKGKRTKRQRSISPHKAAPAVTSTSSSGCGGGYGSISSPTSNCSEVYQSTEEEEEDMANCLILLAQGEGPKVQASNKFANTTTNKTGFYVYECKTCNRSFPSFQALGGHRASHKKPKPTVGDEKKPPLPVAPPVIDDNFDDHCQLNKTSTCSTNLDHHHHHHHLISLQKGILGNNNSKSKIHECSICGSEFSSGQALGGHMRRHRANTVNNNNNIIINQVNINDVNNIQTKPKNILSLDLNLPAPEDDHHHRETKFPFASATTKQALVFSAAPALVDCHY
ncbi:hypothetical protein JCGZ_05425 [Jatropha curcas]|uniref:C2H2-type domain-containing protein n=1 Tax=Jatropha curcas TaxID=180498 RepID=A0A067L9P0_JATCU|nr:hypothetical protein JCGZ_05425 [Jatropha curcas]